MEVAALIVGIISAVLAAMQVHYARQQAQPQKPATPSSPTLETVQTETWPQETSLQAADSRRYGSLRDKILRNQWITVFIAIIAVLLVFWSLPTVADWVTHWPIQGGR
ncbi:hypothetical protein ABT340_15565 [Streptosporangium sp. NPDC000239]|uniref:hypothetical protein n=1 Tax=Streptosporangium sp. NPDC000239 TaxID=3154248 RepID=UPI0033224AF3